MFHVLKPKNLTYLSQGFRKFAGISSLMMFISGLFWIFFKAPQDEVQGLYVHILYVHVPASWGALAIYTMMALFSGYGLVMRVPQAFLISKAIAPIGITLCLISLITGSLWGKPTWGTFWVWDARLTSMFILFWFYAIYLQLSRVYQMEKLIPSAFMAVIGVINIPIVKGSVEWWYTLHQKASINAFASSSSMDFQMLIPLLWMTGAFILYTLYIGAIRFQNLTHQFKRDRG